MNSSMTSQRILVSTLIIMAAATTALGNEGYRDPTGEQAAYELNRRRTSNSVRSGEADAVVTGAIAAETPTYNVLVAYNLRFRPSGGQRGETNIEMEEHYFSEEFLEELRVTGFYESDNFKVAHLGFGERSDASGLAYPNCDILRFYDIEDEGDVRDLEITAYVHYGLPVLGAVTLDMRGIWNGLNVRAGLDFAP